MSVKIHLMLNSKILINGDEDSIVATSLLEISNLMVLKVVVYIYHYLKFASHHKMTFLFACWSEIISYSF